MSSFPGVGEELGGYRIEELIGRGGMGVVYLARDTKLGRSVALKVLAPDLAQDEGFRTRFVRESQMAAATDHPNIIPVYDADEADGVLYLAMRYVQGTDLGKVIREQGAMDLGRAIAIVGQIGSALDAAHKTGLIHRDVKPANVLLTSLGSEDEAVDHVYLTDFGLTKRSNSHSRLTETGGFMGTIDYIAPEQIEGKELDHRTDLYALGCVFYECLTGLVPYQKDSDVAVMYAHLMDERPLVSASRPDLPKELDAIVARAMNREPSDRYDSGAAMVADARRVSGITSSGPNPISVPSRRSEASEGSRRRRWLIPTVALLLVVLAAGFALSRPDEGERDPRGVAPQSDNTPAALAWRPSAGDTLQLQLSGKLDTSYEADIYGLDMHEATESAIDALHDEGRKVVCYLSAGAWEEWRPDAESFPVGLLGNNLEGSTTERWLDIRELEALRPILGRRVAECADKGFDGIKFDNIDAFANDSGFQVSRAHQSAFNRMLADLAHEHGLAAGLTNAPNLAPELEADFDFAISFGCYQYNECGFYKSFVEAGKPVFVIEFELDNDEFCDQAEADGFAAQRKRYSLGAWRDACWD